MAEGFSVPSETGLTISEQGWLAVAKRSAACVELYRNLVGDTGDTRSSGNETITEHLVRPYDVCFAPNNHLVITDNGDNCIKVYNLVGKPRLVSKFICHERNGNTVIEKTECNPGSPPSSKNVTPQSITAGPSPLCQLFVVFAPLNHIVVITMDWNTVEAIDFQQLSPPRDWASVQLSEIKECDKVTIVHDHTENHKVGGRNPLAITKAHFCAMFYHVTERKRDHISYKCLDGPMCRVGQKSRQRNPKVDYAASVVVYVRLTDSNNRLIFHARYGNCFYGERRNTIHGEYFMLMDDEFRQAIQLLRRERGGNINMFMNKQPCYRSTKHHDKRSDLKKKECAQDLVDFFAAHCSSHGIRLIINLCQLHKVDRVPTRPFENDIRNAQKGMRKMISAGIELKAMTEGSWEQLAGLASIQLPEYQDSEREKLDQHITEFLAGIKFGFKLKPRKPHRKTRVGAVKRH